MFARLQWRITAAYVGLIVLVLLGLGVYLAGFLRAQQMDALEAHLYRQASLIAEEARQRLATDGPTALEPLARRLGVAAGLRVTLIAADGTVQGDSDHDPATMDNHATRPEVREALRSGVGQSQRHSATLERDLLYVAVPIQHEGAVLGVARVALSVGEVEQALNRVALAVGGALAATAALAIALAVALARVTAGRVQALARAAERLAAGELDQTIAPGGQDEVGLLARAFSDMAARLRTHLRALEDERARLAAVLNHMADGVVIADHEGVVRLINPAAARLLGIAPARAEGRSLMAALRDHELANAVSTMLAGNGSGGAPHLVELGQPRRAVRVLASRVPRGQAGEERVLLVLQDVTELRRAETVRREFVANVSHELRTPVAALKALVETLEGGALEDPEAAREFLGRMQVEVDGLAQLVEELLELSRIEAGQGALRLRRVDPGPVVAAAVERLRPLAERQGLSLEVRLAEAPPAATLDPERVQQVVANLVHNAVKFTPPGGRVLVRVERRDGELAVVVADTGAGIPAEALPRLFERFYKADRARAGGGTGLGLAIAKHVVQAHGGRIWAESPGEGQGATFTFTLPLQESSASP